VECGAGHASLVLLARAVNIEIAQAHHLRAGTLPAPAQLIDLTSTPYIAERTRTGGTIRVDLPQGSVNNVVYVEISIDPAAAPLEVDPARITAANAQLNGRSRILADSITEFNMYTSTGSRYTGLFDHEAVIRLPYADADNDGFVDGIALSLRPQSLSVYVLNESAGQWEAVPSTVDTLAHQIVARIRHFSVYALISGPSGAASLDGVKVYPNPFSPPAQHTNFVVNMSEDGSVEIE